MFSNLEKIIRIFYFLLYHNLEDANVMIMKDANRKAVNNVNLISNQFRILKILLFIGISMMHQGGFPSARWMDSYTHFHQQAHLRNFPKWLIQISSSKLVLSLIALDMEFTCPRQRWREKLATQLEITLTSQP